MKHFFIIILALLSVFVGDVSISRAQQGWKWGDFSPPIDSSNIAWSYNKKGKYFPDLTLINERMESAHLSDFKGKFVLVNLWATWCAPCITELPSLDKLQKEMGSDLFEVVAVSLDQDKQLEIGKFFNENGIDSLNVWVDEKGSSRYIENLSGMPTTFLIDPFRKELVRIDGPADWSEAYVRDILKYYLNLWDSKSPERIKACEKDKQNDLNPYEGECK